MVLLHVFLYIFGVLSSAFYSVSNSRMMLAYRTGSNLKLKHVSECLYDVEQGDHMVIATPRLLPPLPLSNPYPAMYIYEGQIVLTSICLTTNIQTNDSQC